MAETRFYQFWRPGRTDFHHASGLGRTEALYFRTAHALNYCMVLPGPEAQQLATYIGWLMHRTWGGLFAGLLFSLPSLFLLVESTHGNLKFTAPLTAITAAVVGVILNLAVFFAWHVFWPHGFAGRFDGIAALIGLFALLALTVTKQASFRSTPLAARHDCCSCSSNPGLPGKEFFCEHLR